MNPKTPKSFSVFEDISKVDEKSRTYFSFREKGQKLLTNKKGKKDQIQLL